MADLSTYSDDELRKAAGIETMSDDELMAIAGVSGPPKSIPTRLYEGAKKDVGGFAKGMYNLAADVLPYGINEGWRIPLSETGRGIQNILLGVQDVANRRIAPVQSTTTPERLEEARAAVAPLKEGVRSLVKDPFGTAANYVIDNPIDTLMNLSAGLGVAGKAAAIPKLTTAAKATNPLSAIGLALSPVEAGVRKLAGKAAPSLYESALKIPPASVSNVERRQIIKTGLEGGYPVSQKGFNLLEADIDTLNRTIAETIDNMPQTKTVTATVPGKAAPFEPIIEPAEHGAGFTVKIGPQKYVTDSSGTPQWYSNEQKVQKMAGALKRRPDYVKALEEARPESTVSSEVGTISMADVVKRIDDLKAFYGNLPAAVAKDYLKPLNKLQHDFATAGFITPSQAQKMKQTLYALNRKHYGELSGTVVEGNKAVARGLKEEIAAQEPNISELNKRDSELINLSEVLDRAVNRTRNYDIIRLGDTIMTIPGTVIGGPAGGAIGFGLKRAAESPALKSKLGVSLARIARNAPTSGRINPVKTALLYDLAMAKR